MRQSVLLLLFFSCFHFCSMLQCLLLLLLLSVFSSLRLLVLFHLPSTIPHQRVDLLLG